MDDISVISELLGLNPHSALSSRPTANNIANYIKLPTAL
jgi:hypothetical protein